MPSPATAAARPTPPAARGRTITPTSTTHRQHHQLRGQRLHLRTQRKQARRDSAAYGNSYGYDGNGNQTTRTIAGTTYNFVFDYENRLTEVKQGATSLATFLYDADGNRVKGTVRREQPQCM
jgi:outer membrane protein TolC